jgi:hypothetical protein
MPDWKGGRPRLPLKQKRRNRVVVMLTDAELKALKRLAGHEPLASAAYRIVSRALKRETRQ